MLILGKAGMYWRFARDLRKFFKEPVTLEQSRQILRQRLADRDKHLLAVVKRAVYENERSPYLKLLRCAGCEYGDFEHMVLSDGVESALKILSDKGVYISYEEFKGKKDIHRSGNVFRFKERDFDNPLLAGHIEAMSGASRSTGTRTIYDFEFLTSKYTIHHLISYDIYGIMSYPFGIWFSIIGVGPAIILTSAQGGITPRKWFSPVHKKGFKPSLQKRLAANYIIWMGRLYRANLPTPEYVPLNEASKVAHWIASMVSETGGCSLRTYTSHAVRICEAARDSGVDIKGITFIVGGEPVTETKRKVMESVGAMVCPSYGLSEAGVVGSGCTNPASTDDVHLYKDSFALIQRPREVAHAATSIDAFLLTTLLPSAPKVMLNVESGDYGTIESRDCGCGFHKIGLDEHILNIRGFDKLTGEGMTFVGLDLLRIIDEVLPSRFGGSPNDYQMVECEDMRGFTRLNIIVSPAVGEIDEADLVQTVLAELGSGKDANRMMTHIWAQAKTLEVKRKWPFTTDRGKILPLHIQKRK